MTPVWFNDGSKCVDVGVTEEDCVRCLILEVSLDVFSQTHTCKRPRSETFGHSGDP